MATLFTLDSNLACPLSGLILEAENSRLESVKFVKQEATAGSYEPCSNSSVIKMAMQQLDEYFAGTRRLFSVPYKLHGTVFQKKIWKLIAKIPFGETRSYGEIAKAAGGANLARAVGGAANRNPLPVIVPCHRVIGSSGDLTGFAPGVDVKRFLLDLERRYR